MDLVNPLKAVVVKNYGALLGIYLLFKVKHFEYLFFIIAADLDLRLDSRQRLRNDPLAFSCCLLATQVVIWIFNEVNVFLVFQTETQSLGVAFAQLPKVLVLFSQLNPVLLLQLKYLIFKLVT